jgi:integrase
MARKRRGRGEGAVFFSQSKNSWVARAIIGLRPDGKPLLKEVTAQTKGEVLAKMRKAEEDARAGRVGDTVKMTVGQYLAHWLENTAKPSVEPGTWTSYERCVRLHLTPRVGGISLLQLRPLHVEALFAQMQRDGVSGGNTKKVSEVLSTALEHAVRVEMLPSNPAAPVAKPKTDGEEIVPFTQEEIDRICLAAAEHRLEALFVLAICTGAREGELLGLGWDHVNLDERTIFIQRTLDHSANGFRLKEKPKSERGRRVVDLPSFAVQALAEHRKRMLKEGLLSAPVLFCTKTGHFISKSSFIKQVHRPMLVRASVPYRKFHTFRHTHVSRLLAAGESLVDVAQRVGDRPEVILKTYAHWIPGAGKRIAGRLEEMYGGANRQGGVKVESAKG